MAEHPNRLTNHSVRSIAASLREFGYKSVTDQYVREVSDGLLARIAKWDDSPDIVVMMIRRQLIEAGLL